MELEAWNFLDIFDKNQVFIQSRPIHDRVKCIFLEECNINTHTFLKHHFFCPARMFMFGACSFHILHKFLESRSSSYRIHYASYKRQISDGSKTIHNIENNCQTLKQEPILATRCSKARQNPRKWEGVTHRPNDGQMDGWTGPFIEVLCST